MDKIDESMILLKSLNNAEEEYKKYKFQLDLVKAEFSLNINWDKVNENRIAHGKTKITNEANRKYYLRLHFAEEDEKLLDLELAYKFLLREYEDVCI